MYLITDDRNTFEQQIFKEQLYFLLIFFAVGNLDVKESRRFSSFFWWVRDFRHGLSVAVDGVKSGTDLTHTTMHVLIGKYTMTSRNPLQLLKLRG